jgi:hypothetical protein
MPGALHIAHHRELKGFSLPEGSMVVDCEAAALLCAIEGGAT